MPVIPGAEPFFHSGGSTAVLLCHGFTGNPSSMRPWAEYLAAAGLTVSLPRLPGHGTTWQEMAGTRWEDWYAEIDRAYEDLRGQAGEIFVMGLSMGGTLALRLTELRGDGVAGLVLVNPSLTDRSLLARLAPVFGHVVPSIKGVGSDIKKEGAVELAYDRVPGRAAVSLAKLWKVTLRGSGSGPKKWSENDRWLLARMAGPSRGTFSVPSAHGRNRSVRIGPSMALATQ